MRGVVAVLLGLMVGGVAANPNDAFRAGKTLGAGAGQRAASQISTGSAADKVPAYGTNPAEAAYFQGGKGDLTGHGITKMQSCATATPDSDPIKRQECEAVNFLARNPNVRPQFDLSNNPMFDKAKNIRNNAENIFASPGVGGTGSSTQCVPRTITTYSTDTCSSIREVGEQQCTMGRVINIDTDANFQCDKNINAYETLKCRKTYDVSCTGGGTGCSPSGIDTSSVTISGFGRILLHRADGSYWFLSAGTIMPDGSRDNNSHFGGYFNNVFQSDIYFNITNKANIATFFIDQAHHGDYIMIWLNGSLVVHSAGGSNFFTTDFMEGRASIRSYGGVELKHLLRDGSNHIRIRLVVDRNGDGIVRFKTKAAYCPMNCSATLRDNCAALEARSR